MDKSTGWPILLEELAFQRQCLDMLNASWVADYNSRGGVIHCARGCNCCCMLAVNCTLTEAIELAGTLNQSQLAKLSDYAARLKDLISAVSDMKGYLQMQRRDMGICPLLVDGSCGAYASRPLACRSLLSTRESYWCGVDFSSVPAAEKEQYLASLDRTVTAFPLHYVASAQDSGREFEARLLAHMQELFGFSCYGCMPVVVTLVHTHGLADADSREQAERLVEAAGFANPLLVSW